MPLVKHCELKQQANNRKFETSVLHDKEHLSPHVNPSLASDLFLPDQGYSGETEMAGTTTRAPRALPSSALVLTAFTL
ncbi:hypothetical protein N7513_003313 [Penicillium frequentans]|nr:hypothetical protein N7513_003313 [Penicillium glabrum]